ncbi:hypothetical protein [Desulfatibacillum aliphaticivorans]|uniref:hypothetical protein n=1 Tax=Desulfatibacillum aliphaticivorans TaxID=218208 RepID=UPI0012F750BF|nr:hypothetical protein [Desulfatibacillum aliphaticivorans]
MSNKEQSQKSGTSKGYQPFNDGYQPSEERGYSPSTTTGSHQGTPSLPAGGSAQSQSTQEGSGDSKD